MTDEEKVQAFAREFVKADIRTWEDIRRLQALALEAFPNLAPKDELPAWAMEKAREMVEGRPFGFALIPPKTVGGFFIACPDLKVGHLDSIRWIITAALVEASDRGIEKAAAFVEAKGFTACAADLRSLKESGTPSNNHP